MNDNWIEIVYKLTPHVEKNSSEMEYQRDIENCLVMLGWRCSNKTMQSQVLLPVGNNNSIRPDIVLYKDGQPVLPIEIKRPTNKRNERQEDQLMSYMRQFKLNVGLYIGENIQLYYDNPDDISHLKSVFTVELKEEDANGEKFCDLLLYEKFNLKRLEDFCKECYNQIIARNNLKRRLSEFFSDMDVEKNLISLIKEKFIKEGFDEQTLDNELHGMTIHIEWQGKNNSTQDPTHDTGAHTNTESGRFFSFDGKNFFNKRRFVLNLIKYYVKDNPGVTFTQLEQTFPQELQTSSYGVVRTLGYVNEKAKLKPDIRKRYFLEREELIKLDDETEVAVCNQWGDNFNNFIKKAKLLYNIISSNTPYQQVDLTATSTQQSQTSNHSKSPAHKLKISFSEDEIIMEKDAISSFKEFIHHIGISKVASLNIIARGNTPLISKEKDEKYAKFQRQMKDGYLLFANFSTASLKKLTEEISTRLGIPVKVEETIK